MIVGFGDGAVLRHYGVYTMYGTGGGNGIGSGYYGGPDRWYETQSQHAALGHGNGHRYEFS